MSGRRVRVSTAPLAIASNGDLVVNAHQLAMKDDMSAAVEVAQKSGLHVFVGVIVPRRLVPAVMHDVDDGLADVVGRLGPRLIKRRGRRA